MMAMDLAVSTPSEAMICCVNSPINTPQKSCEYSITGDKSLSASDEYSVNESGYNSFNYQNHGTNKEILHTGESLLPKSTSTVPTYETDIDNSTEPPPIEYVKRENDLLFKYQNEVSLSTANNGFHQDDKNGLSTKNWVFDTCKNLTGMRTNINDHGSNHSNATMMGSPSIFKLNFYDYQQQQQQNNIPNLVADTIKLPFYQTEHSEKTSSDVSTLASSFIDSASKTFISNFSELAFNQLMHHQQHQQPSSEYAQPKTSQLCPINSGYVDSKTNPYWSYWTGTNHPCYLVPHLNTPNAQTKFPSTTHAPDNNYYTQHENLQSYASSTLQSTPVSNHTIGHSKHFSAFHSVPLLIENNPSQLTTCQSSPTRQNTDAMSLQYAHNNQVNKHFQTDDQQIDDKVSEHFSPLVFQSSKEETHQSWNSAFSSFDTSFDGHIAKESQTNLNFLESTSRKCGTVSKNKTLNQNALEVMEKWYLSNLDHPYPSASIKNELAVLGQITVTQVNSWFANRRTRSSNTRPKKNRAKMFEKFEQLASEIESFTQGLISADALLERFGAIVSAYLG